MNRPARTEIFLAPIARNRLLRIRYNAALGRFGQRGGPEIGAAIAFARRHCATFGYTATAAKRAWDDQEAGLPHDARAAWRWYRSIILAAGFAACEPAAHAVSSRNGME